MKNFLNLCKQRHSVRKYLPKKVPKEKILRCIEAARIAPSAENLQPWRYMIIDKEPLLSAIKKTAFGGIYSHTKWAKTSPVIIVILAKYNLPIKFISSIWKKMDYYLLDIGIATQQLVLQAEDMELGTCWIGWFNVKKTQKLLQLPKKYKLIGLLTLGYFNKKKNLQKKRKKINEIAWFNKTK